MLLKFIGTSVLTLVIFVAQKYWSTRKMWQLGVIVPLISIATLTGIHFAKQIPLNDFLFPCAILIILELIIWVDGRHQHGKEELMNMKAKEID